MNNILILNFKRHGDIIQTGHLASSLKQQYPHSQIGVLSFKEFSTSSKILKDVDQHFFIPREEIITFYKNDLYSDGFGVDLLHRSLKNLQNTDWDQIVNFSNDRFSTWCTSYLSTTMQIPFSGISFDQYTNIKYSDKWALLYNDVMTTFPFTPFCHADAFNNMLGLKHKGGSRFIQTNAKHDITVHENFEKLREETKKVIGIQLKSSLSNKDIPFSVFIDLIRNLLDSEKYVPVLLVAPFENEKLYANKINKEFDNKLISIEADLIALPSVIASLDALITPDTISKHLSDGLETPCVEVSLGAAPLFKQGSLNPQSVVLTNDPCQRKFSYQSDEEANNINGLDIFKALNFITHQATQEELSFSQSVVLYRPLKDTLGTVLVDINKASNIEFEFKRILARQFCLIFTEKEHDEALFDYLIHHFNEKEFNALISQEKDSIGLISKDLLATLRGLIQTQESITNGKGFVDALTQLLTNCEGTNLVSIPVLLFRAQIESLEPKVLQENIKEVEFYLYDLKDNIQNVMRTLNDFEKTLADYRNQKMISRVRERPNIES